MLFISYYLILCVLVSVTKIFPPVEARSTSKGGEESGLVTLLKLSADRAKANAPIIMNQDTELFQRYWKQRLPRKTSSSWPLRPSQDSHEEQSTSAPESIPNDHEVPAISINGSSHSGQSLEQQLVQMESSLPKLELYLPPADGYPLSLSHLKRHKHQVIPQPGIGGNSPVITQQGFLLHPTATTAVGYDTPASTYNSPFEDTLFRYQVENVREVSSDRFILKSQESVPSKRPLEPLFPEITTTIPTITIIHSDSNQDLRPASSNGLSLVSLTTPHPLIYGFQPVTSSAPANGLFQPLPQAPIASPLSSVSASHPQAFHGPPLYPAAPSSPPQAPFTTHLSPASASFSPQPNNVHTNSAFKVGPTNPFLQSSAERPSFPSVSPFSRPIRFPSFRV